MLESIGQIAIDVKGTARRPRVQRAIA